MDVSCILDGLNDSQREAVTNDSRIIRVVAGAGSGKTRVLVNRIQWLMLTQHCPSYAILALTFTNKAAHEMRQRLEQQLNYKLKSMWIGTFHHICHRILRQFAERAGWSNHFTIMDSDDQLQMIRRLMRQLEWDDALMKPKQLMWQINAYKEAGKRSTEELQTDNLREQDIWRFYRIYETQCRRQNTMDFTELLLLVVELLESHTDILTRFHQQFQAVLVDEFQDTNALQFRLIHLLVGEKTQLFVVGDDDQSIYGWRGARVENILQLQTYYSQLATIRLEQNYRSTQTILDAANHVIAHNRDRLGKNLWSAAGKGEKIRVYSALNEYDEAQYVLKEIQRYRQDGIRFQNCAILYRSNAQSRIFEEVCLQERIPYRVYGGMRFFDRTEIKDALAYLRLAIHPTDDTSVERVINVPARGIGAKTMSIIRELSRVQQTALINVIADEANLRKHLPSRACVALAKFRSVIARLSAGVQTATSLKSALALVVQQSGLYEAYSNDNDDSHQMRRDNLDELINAGSEMDVGSALDNEKIMNFLAEAALDAGDTQAGEGQDSVQMMTLHSAKGLEFDHVFIVGMEESLFPTHQAIEQDKILEEERRLAYVGITRARQTLTLCFAERRRFQGQAIYPQVSRFIREIPESLIQLVRPGVFISAFDHSASTDIATKSDFCAGDRVRHPKLGDGFIVQLEGRGEHQRALVRFTSAGEKWLVLAYAKLEKIVA